MEAKGSGPREIVFNLNTCKALDLTVRASRHSGQGDRIRRLMTAFPNQTCRSRGRMSASGPTTDMIGSWEQDYEATTHSSTGKVAITVATASRAGAPTPCCQCGFPEDAPGSGVAGARVERGAVATEHDAGSLGGAGRAEAISSRSRVGQMAIPSCPESCEETAGPCHRG